jgi:uncharacterized alkaline shock family protein YloU
MAELQQHGTELPPEIEVRPPVTRGADQPRDQGRTTVADTVVAKIAGRATREVSGVHEIVPQGVGGAISGLAQRVAGSERSGQGVSVEVGEHEAAVDLRIIVDYGASIPQVADAIRRNVASRVKSMTGLTVTEVNIDVADLYYAEASSAAQPPAVQARRVE